MAKKSDQFKQENSRDKRVKGSVKKLAAKLWELFTPKEIGKKLGVSTQKATAIKKGIDSGKIYNPDVRSLLQQEVIKGELKRDLNKIGKRELKKANAAADKKQKKYIKNIKKYGKIEKPKPKKKREKISKELKEFLKDQGITLKEFKKQSRKIQKEIKQEFKDTVKQIGREGEIYYPTTKALKQDYTNFKVASYRHNSYESALNWWKGVTGGAGYFVILRKKSKKTGQEVFFVVDIDPNRKRKGEGKKSKKKNNYQTDRALKLEKKFIEESEDF